MDSAFPIVVAGFAIEGRRILTNYHVIANATDIRLRKHGSSKRWAARVLTEAHDVALALVEVLQLFFVWLRRQAWNCLGARGRGGFLGIGRGRDMVCVAARAPVERQRRRLSARREHHLGYRRRRQ